jgi:hypothetical protein
MKINLPGMRAIEATPANRPTRTSAELMSDSAIYRRTPQGQRELLRAADPAATPALRLLARFNGYTDLRRLIDLAPGDTREMSKAIQQLFRDGLIELVDLSM